VRILGGCADDMARLRFLVLTAQPPSNLSVPDLGLIVGRFMLHVRHMFAGADFSDDVCKNIYFQNTIFSFV
jgi:hypothetical protein